MAMLSQLPSDVDLAFVAGDTFRIRVRVVDPGTGEPLDLADPDAAGPLSAYGFCAQIAKLPDRSIVSAFAITPDPDAPTEAVILTLSSTETEYLLGAPGSEFNGIWDLEVRFPNGDVRTVAKGTVRCVDDVSTCSTIATGATAGKPGTWTPATGMRPATVAALQSASPAIVASPSSTWTSGQYIQTDTQGAAGEAHWNGTAWVAGRKP